MITLDRSETVDNPQITQITQNERQATKNTKGTKENLLINEAHKNLIFFFEPVLAESFLRNLRIRHLWIWD